MANNLVPETPKIKEIYDFGGGINTSATNESLRDASSPYLRNVRYRSHGTVRTRRGPGYYSDPIDEVQDAVKTTAPNGNQSLSMTTKLAAKFFPSVTQSLTRLDLNIRLSTGAGIVRVELWSDAGGVPGAIIAESSIQGAVIGASYAYLPARFLAAPTVTAFTNYWIVAYIQSDGSGAYQWSSTSTGTTSLSNTGNAGWVATAFDLNFKMYSAPANPVLGLYRFYKSDGTKVTIVANKKGVHTVNDITGAITRIFTGSASATSYSFDAANDTLFWANGFDAPQQWNGTTTSAIAGSPPIARFLKVHKNRLFLVSTADPTRIVFSDAGDFGTYQPVSFLYVPTPKSPDPIYGLISLQDNLFIWTRQTKYVLYGSDIASFTLRRSTGLQGTASSDSLLTYDNFAFSVSDNGVYEFNGATDNLISDSPASISNIQPDFLAVDRQKMATGIFGNLMTVYYPTPGSPVNNAAFVFDLIYRTWYIDDQSYFAKAFTFKGNGDAETMILGSSVVGQVFYADRQDSDMGMPIGFDYRTQYESFDFPSRNKQIKRFYPEFTGQQSDYTCEVYVDINEANAPNLIAKVSLIKAGPVWGKFVWGQKTWGAFGNIKPRLNVTGKFFSRQYRFQHRGVDNPVELVGISEYYFIRNAR